MCVYKGIYHESGYKVQKEISQLSSYAIAFHNISQFCCLVTKKKIYISNPFKHQVSGVYRFENHIKIHIFAGEYTHNIVSNIYYYTALIQSIRAYYRFIQWRAYFLILYTFNLVHGQAARAENEKENHIKILQGKTNLQCQNK